VISANGIIIDAKSGTSGAGRGAKEAFLYCEVTDGMHAYGVGRHRHMPEIEQGLYEAVQFADGDSAPPIRISFTPHLIPMSRGMLCTMYCQLEEGMTVDECRSMLKNMYEGEPFVHVLEEGVVPQTRHVRGSNMCLLSVFPDRIPGRVIVLSAIDNLVKGAAGQAIQNMNILMGYSEVSGLMQQPMFP